MSTKNNFFWVTPSSLLTSKRKSTCHHGHAQFAKFSLGENAFFRLEKIVTNWHWTFGISHFENFCNKNLQKQEMFALSFVYCCFFCFLFVFSVVWKSCLFPRAQSSFRVRSWVPMKRLQQSCAKLKLCTGLMTRAAYLKPCPWHPASVESNSLRQEWVNKCLKRMLEFDSTVAVRLSRGHFVPQCHAWR